MEFKGRKTQKEKALYKIARKDAGYVRIKIRGRKRWVKAEKKA